MDLLSGYEPGSLEPMTLTFFSLFSVLILKLGVQILACILFGGLDIPSTTLLLG